MKNILKHYAKYILLDTFAVAVLFVAAHAILSLFHLMFIKWIYLAIIGIIIIGILLGIFQLLLKIRKTYVKYIGIGIMTICLIPLTYIGIWVFAFTYQPMHIVEKDGIKYVAYVRAFLHTYIDYYEYRNLIITGDEVLFTEDFGKGGFDPFERGYTDYSMIEEETITDDRVGQNVAPDGENTENEPSYSGDFSISNDDTSNNTDSDGYPLTEDFQSYKKELSAIATYINNSESYQVVEAGDELNKFLEYHISAKGYPYVNIAEQTYAGDGVSVKATHYIIINELYAKDGLREYVYQIRFEDEFGNEADSTVIANFYLIDTETLAVTDEETNVWH